MKHVVPNEACGALIYGPRDLLLIKAHRPYSVAPYTELIDLKAENLRSLIRVYTDR